MAGNTNDKTGEGLEPKAMLTFAETAAYLGVSKGYLYQQTMTRRIPHYKPNGKKIYFDKAEIDKWLHRNRVAPADELAAAANGYCRQNNIKNA